MKRIIITTISILFLISCNKKKFYEGPNTYSDGFENYSIADDLLEGEDVNWSFFQGTYPENTIEVSTEHSFEGNNAMKFTAAQANPEVGASKASIAKQKMAFYDGETVSLSAWYFLEGEKELEYLFLMDLEEQVAIGAGPGMRLGLLNNKIFMDFKFKNDNLIQNGDGTQFPRNEWVKVEIKTKLSQKKKGWVEIYQNDVLIAKRENFKTLPKDNLYFQQGTKGMYQSIEFGLTANSITNDAVLFVDNISVKTIQ